ncbi:MAG: response regulator, partial [Deltaproteobacteria bacterium]
GMGIFRRSSAAPAPALDPAAALAEGLRAIAAHEAPEDALQPALQAILEATGAQAGALCLFDVRYGLLRLAAEVGISDEGCRALRSIRQDDARGWALPLQCLRDRRPYLIDAASGAHHVPPLVEAGAAMRSVACVPLCAGETPLGSLVLVARAPRALSEHDVEQLAGPLDEVVRMIETARRPRAGAAAPAREPSGVVAEPAGACDEVAPGAPEPASLAAKLAARSEEADRLRAALEAAGVERARLAGELEQARRAADRAELLTASLAAAERETAELAAALERGESGGHERLQEAVEQARAAEAARAAAEAELASARTALADAEARSVALEAEGRRARAEIERLELAERDGRAERERMEKELAETRARFDELATHGNAVEGEIGVLRELVATLRSELVTLAAERDRLLGAPGEPEAERATNVEAEDPPAPAAAELAPSESPPAPAAPPTPAAPPRPRVHGARRLVVVLDVDPVWEGAVIDGTEVTVVKPGSDVFARFVGVTPARLVVNLAAPGALAAMGALRAAGVSGRFWGCLASPASDKALPLGMIEPATRPLDPDAVLLVLGGYAPRGTRIVTAGADGDTLMSLRHALTRQGLSVSMAWDAKQAVDLFEAVRPEVVVLDLELPPRHGYELVVRLAGSSPVPSAVLVYGEGDDTGAGFAAALRAAPRNGLVPRDRLLADVLGHSEVPPEARPKVYALPQRR